jgi:hypothetical protein
VDVAGRASDKEKRAMVKQQKKLTADIEAGRAAAAAAPKPKPKKAKPAPYRPPVQAPVPATKLPTKPRTGDGAASNGMRGYKVRADGTKTSFFDTEWDEETKKLYASKPQGPTKLTSADAAPAPTAKPGAAVWNSGGTYEESNMSDWASARLRELMSATDGALSVQVDAEDGFTTTLTGTGVRDLKCEATCPFVRGARRHLFEASFALTFTCPSPDGGEAVKGTLTFPEVTDDADGEYEASLSFSAGSQRARDCLRKYLLGGQETLQGRVVAQLGRFVDEYATK